MNGVIGDGCPTSARNDSDIFQRDIPAELCQHSHSGCMMNGNILQLNILAAVEDQSRTEPRFMPDYQSVGQNSVRQIRYSDQTVPFQQSAVRNLNTPEDALRARAGTPPAVAVVGWHNAGKTTFLRGLIPALTARGVRVAAIKHDAHGFEMDHEDTDTWHLRRAGAESAAILGPGSWAVLGQGERTLEDIRRTLPKVDLILAEGFKYSPLPKLEIHRKAAGHPLIVQDETLLAVLTDEPLETEAPQMSLTDFETCADLLCRQFDLPEKKS